MPPVEPCAGAPALHSIERETIVSETADSTLPARTYEASPYPCAPASGAPADFRAGTAALAAMADDEFELRLIAMRRGRERITRIHRELMDPNSDYGVIP